MRIFVGVTRLRATPPRLQRLIGRIKVNAKQALRLPLVSKDYSLKAVAFPLRHKIILNSKFYNVFL